MVEVSTAAPIPPPLPDYVQIHFDELVTEDRELGLSASSRETLEALAWRRWARTISNIDLADFAMMLRVEIVQDGNNPLGIKLEEVYRRLRFAPKS
jgi:hypothetical protein